MKIVFKDSNTKFLNILICLSIIVSTIIQISLFQKSFWLDEKFTILNSNGLDKNGVLLFNKQDNNNIVDLYHQKINSTEGFNAKAFKLMNNTNNVILANVLDNSGNNLAYFLLLHLIDQLIPLSADNIRFISYLFWLFSLLLFYKIVKYILKDKFAIKVAIILFILNPTLIRYSADARAYSMGLFFCLLGFYFLSKRIYLNDKSINNYLLFFITFLFSVFTHYLTLFFYAACFFLELFSKSDFAKKRATIAFYAIINILVIVLLYTINNDGFKVMKEISMTHKYVYNKLTPSYTDKIIGYIGGIIEIFSSFFGCLLADIGIRSRQYFPLIFSFIPFLIYPLGGTKKIMYSFLTVALSSSLLMAILSGHAASFTTRYYIWFIPLIIFALAAYFNTTKLKDYKSKISFIAVFLFYISAIVILYLDYPLKRKADMYQGISNKLNFDDVNKIYYSNVRDAMMFNLYNNIPENITQQVIADSSRFMRLINSEGENKQYIKLDLVIKEW